MAGVLVVLVAVLGVTAAEMAGETGARHEGFDVAGELELCRHEVRAWLSAHASFVRTVGEPSWSCVWEPGGGSGGYDAARNHVDFKPWGRYHWNIASRRAFYAMVASHEYAHAYGARIAHIDDRVDEYAAVRGIPTDGALEDYAVTLDKALGWPGVWWTCSRRLAARGYCSTSATPRQVALLRSAGFLPD